MNNISSSPLKKFIRAGLSLRTAFIMLSLILAGALLYSFLRPHTPASTHQAAMRSQAPSQSNEVRASEAYARIPLSFEANLGQTDEQVKFLSRGQGYGLFLTADEAVLALRKNSVTGEKDKETARPSSAIHVLKMKVAGANKGAQAAGLEELPGKNNYFIGNDPEKWRTEVPTYTRVKYTEIYPGVDMVYYGNQRQLEYDFILAPGADARQIELAFEGARSVSIEANGELSLKLADGEVRQHKPFIYQEVNGARQEVAGRYVSKGSHAIGFEVGQYDATRPLVIDPVLVYSTYLGGTAYDAGYGIAIDAQGNAYVTGMTSSLNFPTTAGSLKPTMQPLTGTSTYYGDAFVTKLNASGSALVYSTFLGGTVASEIARGIAVDNQGNAYITGVTGGGGVSAAQNDFPTVNAFQSTFGGTDDAFVTKLNPSGSALVFSTYLGGNSSEIGFRIVVNTATGESYTAGSAGANFPTTPGAFKPLICPEGGCIDWLPDGFITKFGPDGGAPQFSTYLGGSGGEYAYDIALDAQGNTYITGTTTSTNFPVTAGAYQTVNSGTTPQPLSPGTDAFVTKMNPTGSGLIYSTYLGGGPQSDRGFGIDVDAAGNAYVTGQTQSAGFPATQGAFDMSYNNGSDAFVTKFNPEGTALIYSTFLGGALEDVGNNIIVNPAGEVFIAGQTKSTAFPTHNSLQPKAAQPTFPDVFLTRLNAAGSTLIFSTFLGAGDARDVVLDQSGNAYLTGEAVLIPVTTGVFQPTKGSTTTNDGFVMKVGPADESAQTFSIGGTVTDLNPDPDDAPVTITLSGDANRVITLGPTTNAYSFGQLPAGGTYTVTPSKPGFIFSPQSETFTNLGANLTAEFTVQVNEKPTTTLTTPVHNDSFNSPGPIPIAATAADADGTVARVEFSAYSSTLGNIIISTDTTAPYEATWTNVAPGDYNVYATAYDNLGRRGDGDFAFIHVLSTSAPVVTLTSPAEGASYEAGTNVPVNANVTASGQITVVEFYAGTELVARDTQAPYGFSWWATTPGSYALTAKAFDNGGASGVSAPVNVTITTASPDIYGMVLWRGEGLAGVTVTLSGAQNLSVTTGADGRYRFENVTPGANYTVTPTHAGYTFYPVQKVYAPMGNYDTNANFEATQISPVSAMITSPSFFQQYNAPANVTINVTAQSTAGPMSKVEFYAIDSTGTTLIGDDFTAPYSITWNNVAAGTYQLYVVATDSTSASVHSQNTPIRVNPSPNLVMIHGQVKDGSGFGMPGIRITLSGTQSGTAITNLNGYYGFGNLPINGDYTVTAPTDYTFEPASYTFNNLTADVLDRNFVTDGFNQVPLVEMTSPSSGTTFGMPVNIPVSANASDTDGTVTKVIFYRNNGTSNTVVYEDTIAPYNFLWQPTAPGDYTLTAVAVDNGGRRATSAPVTLTVNGPSPVSISGRVVDRNSAGIEEALMTLERQQQDGEWLPQATILTDANGSYSFASLQTFVTYRISASKLSYTFAPAQRTYFNLNVAQTADITATLSLQRSDFDGDGRTDAAVWRPDTGVWYINRTTDGATVSQQFGAQQFGDIPVPGNYDGDKKTDIAVFRPSNAMWYILRSSNNAVSYKQWGLSTDKPMAGDYDGDGKTDLAVFRPSASAWYIERSSDGGMQSMQFGAAGDMPVAGDYDGDGKFDIAVWRPSNGTWYVQQSADGVVKAMPWGMNGDIAVGGDYDGDKKMDYAVFRPSNGYWYITLSRDGATRFINWGISGDKPIAGDYDLDGKTDIAVFRPSNGYWYVYQSSNNTLLAQPWGTNGDMPVPSAYMP